MAADLPGKSHPAGTLAGRTAIVTGAGNGIGAATVRRFAAEEGAITLTDLDTLFVRHWC